MQTEPMQKRWNILDADPAIVTGLQQALNIHPMICRMLVQRGITDFELARAYFRPDLKALHDPWLMKDMDKAVARIMEAIQSKEKILLFGDYDVDGTTAVATVFQFLRKVHTDLEFYIPNRYREGYGISKAGIDYARDNGFTLIISLDCGIKSVDLISYASGMGIDFVICDHHMPDDKLPAAVAILNPKQKDCNYPYKELCGCGVGFKLICALAPQLGLGDEAAFEYLDLVATAVAADIVPMTGENRILAYHGLVKANKQPNLGIKALMQLSSIPGELHIHNLVFMIAPRVNAAGRMDDARKAVQMFISETYQEALSFAELLHNDNTERKEADISITEEALGLISGNQSWTNNKSTLVYSEHWHKGVVGIVASRLIEHYYRPTIVLTRSGEYASGSARSVPGFNLYEAIHACRDHLIGYGGHFAAAGMTLEISQVDALREKFEEVVAATIEPQCLVPVIDIDAEIRIKDIRRPFYNILCQMEPFGPENLRPTFLSRKITDSGWSRIVKTDHIRFSVKQDGVIMNGIGFNLAPKFHLLQSKMPVDIVYKIDENEWNGEKNLQLRVIDIRASE